ncbi:MAG TPA: HXXEE domain-containing protein [Gemmataceae bacterium]|nr:HXXEE domain-containing protein [Gemmataceae bacterium]
MNTSSSHSVLRWLVGEWHWPAATLFAGCFLLLLIPVVYLTAGLALTLVYVQLPVYMVHQFEEHTGDRFRTYANLHMAGGREALTPMATFWINSIGVWGVDLLALYLAFFVEPALGLMAVYLPLVNGLAHIGQAVSLREYNPGLGTALLLFLPVGGWGLWVLAGTNASWQAQAIGLGTALAVHLAIIAHVARRIRKLSHSGQDGTLQKAGVQLRL